MSERIAIVGMSCVYPDAGTPEQLWENVLAGRRAFRRLPEERMRLADYYSPDPSAPDRFYADRAAVIDGWEFDRIAYRIAGSTYRTTDLTHWLALDTAARALADAGFADGDGMPRDTTGVIIGNTLTGEFSRANLLRLRWPYVRRTIAALMREQGRADTEVAAFLAELEPRFKAPFPPIDEDTLAGGLANTIAGRVCNYFDFKGGGFTVDGACSSSLLSVVTACNALARGQFDAAVVGGVDLSIDPFEFVGFAKTGALATDEMRVYDRRSNGFWPGEGCGMLVLMRHDDAEARGLRRYADIAGWGYSSDGRGGITRPEADGHRLALTRAYRHAGFGIHTVGYLEGHGTGTAVGDATELRALTAAIRAATPRPTQVALSTVKGNIGHTKAAAGVAGLLKAVLAVHHQVIPPATGHVDPHLELGGDAPALRVPATAELWPDTHPIRAGVSAMGFGGINAHIVVENTAPWRRGELDPTTTALVRSRQDAELLLLDADDVGLLRDLVERVARLTAKLSYAELTDLAVALQTRSAGRTVRAAVVAASPSQAHTRLAALLDALDRDTESLLDPVGGVFLGAEHRGVPSIGFLFPGQGAGRRADGGALRRRFDTVDRLYRDTPIPIGPDIIGTAAAQPRIVTASVAGLRVLADLGIEATASVGHSLGELTALHWAGAMSEDDLLRVAAARGAIMAEDSDGGGTMAGLGAGPEMVRPLLAGENVVIAGYNGPRQTVVSGPSDAVKRVCDKAAAAGWTTMPIAVSHAFHSELVAPAADALGHYLRTKVFSTLTGTVVSTVTGAELAADTDVARHLTRQVLDPVRFSDAVTAMAADTDLLLEVGPGSILRGLANAITPATPVISLETDSMSLTGLLHAVAAAFALGAPVRAELLARGRFARPMGLDKQFRFFISPAEAAPADDAQINHVPHPRTTDTAEPESTHPESPADERPLLELLRELAAQRAELPLAAVGPDCYPLDDLHLSSITFGQIINQACREAGLRPPAVSSAVATASLAEIAEMLAELGSADADRDAVPHAVAGVDAWVRTFRVDLLDAQDPPAPAPGSGDGDGEWALFTTDEHPLADTLHRALRTAGLGGGVLLCLPPDADADHIGLMLAAARAALAAADTRFVAVGDRRGAAALAKTLHLEAPAIDVTVLEVPLRAIADTERLAARIVGDVAATTGFNEVHYDALGARRVPRLTPIPLDATRSGPGLHSDDVVLVTGGGKGITAEATLALARSSGAVVGVIGRSDPAEDPELAANLSRMQVAGVKVHYVRADITAAGQVRSAVEEIAAMLGDITVVLHGAGRNEPRALTELTEEAFAHTLAPKIAGLREVLAAVDPAALRLLVTFSSIIGRAGLRGEADYATANDWLTDLTRRIGADHPNCRCVALEWSVWSGAGMGDRLGVLESLIRDGIAPIPIEDGIAVLEQILADPTLPASLVIMGRAAGLPTLSLARRELPLLRFLERPLVHYPDIELVVEADLSPATDRYLPHHDLDGAQLFPAVFGIEAMAQAASAVTGLDTTPALENTEFLRPIVVAADAPTTIRIAVLVTAPGEVRAVIRSSDTGFQADHFRATLRYPRPAQPEAADPAPRTPTLPLSRDELYGPILFQGPMFQRVTGYRSLAATRCVVELSTTTTAAWFASHIPDGLVLADPGTRDAAMHAIQCCVPDATLLPASIQRLRLADPATLAAYETVTVHAVERSRDGNSYLYDLDVRGPANEILEQWEGLRLEAVRVHDGSGPWPPVLLGPYLERRTDARVVVIPDQRSDRRRATAAAAAWALTSDTTLRYRPDGKPEADGDTQVSAAHGASATMVVARRGLPVACDIETCVERPGQDWAGMLGPDGFALAQQLLGETGETLDVSATRVWTAQECLRKIGNAVAGPLVLDRKSPGRWLNLRSGPTRIATFVTTLRNVANPVAIAVLTTEES
jgi:enediyne polyketide synthase